MRLHPISPVSQNVQQPIRDNMVLLYFFADWFLLLRKCDVVVKNIWVLRYLVKAFLKHNFHKLWLWKILILTSQQIVLDVVQLVLFNFLIQPYAI